MRKQELYFDSCPQKLKGTLLQLKTKYKICAKCIPDRHFSVAYEIGSVYFWYFKFKNYTYSILKNIPEAKMWASNPDKEHGAACHLIYLQGS